MNKKRILLVEDDELTRAVMLSSLTRRGYDVKTAASAEEAFAIIESNTFDLLLSDIGLPGASGLDLIERVRSRNPYLHAIAITALGLDEDRTKIDAAGFSAHLVKPISMEQLDSAIGGLVL